MCYNWIAQYQIWAWFVFVYQKSLKPALKLFFGTKYSFESGYVSCEFGSLKIGITAILVKSDYKQ